MDPGIKISCPHPHPLTTTREVWSSVCHQHHEQTHQICNQRSLSKSPYPPTESENSKRRMGRGVSLEVLLTNALKFRDWTRGQSYRWSRESGCVESSRRWIWGNKLPSAGDSLYRPLNMSSQSIQQLDGRQCHSSLLWIPAPSDNAHTPAGHSTA